MQKRQYWLLLLLFPLIIISACQKKNNPTPSPVKPVAKAPGDTTITLPVSSITFTGHGTDATGTIVGYLWSQVSGPAEAIIVNDGSATASFTSLVAGTYVFQFSVTDNKGLTGVATFSVTVMPAQIVTLTLQPANNPGESEVAVWNGNDWTNHTSVEEPLSAWTKDADPTIIRGLIKFDLSSIPSNATIVEADLQLYSDTIPLNGDLVHANYGTDNSVLIQQVASSWDASSVTWFNQPAGLTANQVIIPTTTLSFLNVDVDVKGLING